MKRIKLALHPVFWVPQPPPHVLATASGFLLPLPLAHPPVAPSMPLGPHSSALAVAAGHYFLLVQVPMAEEPLGRSSQAGTKMLFPLTPLQRWPSISGAKYVLLPP
jgi:hypothetical protein